MTETIQIPSDYLIDCTGDACRGDEIAFIRALFEGPYKERKFVKDELIVGIIVSDSYGKQKQQHTFTIKQPDGTTFRIKGRNLYRKRLYRKPWSDENDRKGFLEEKHLRGKDARQARRIKSNAEFFA